MKLEKSRRFETVFSTWSRHKSERRKKKITVKSIHGHRRDAWARTCAARRLHRSQSCRARKRVERAQLDEDMIRAEGKNLRRYQLSAHGHDVSERRVKGWISERLPGKQGADSHGGSDRGCLGAQATSKIRCGSSPKGGSHLGATGGGGELDTSRRGRLCPGGPDKEPEIQTKLK